MSGGNDVPDDDRNARDAINEFFGLVINWRPNTYFWMNMLIAFAICATIVASIFVLAHILTITVGDPTPCLRKVFN